MEAARNSEYVRPEALQDTKKSKIDALVALQAAMYSIVVP